jgi:hypothetical protein
MSTSRGRPSLPRVLAREPSTAPIRQEQISLNVRQTSYERHDFVAVVSSMRELVVRTQWPFACPASKVWSLMCNSQMDDTASLLFKLGVPQPIRCRVTGSQPGVGSERECVSDQGVVHQRILEWTPGKRLSFRMESTELAFRRYVRELVDTFDLSPTSTGVAVTRTTQVWTRGRAQYVRRVPLYLSLKKVHRFVFQNWVRLASRGAPSSISRESGLPSPPSA